jgi:hypothetical protein
MENSDTIDNLRYNHSDLTIESALAAFAECSAYWDTRDEDRQEQVELTRDLCLGFTLAAQEANPLFIAHTELAISIWQKAVAATIYIQRKALDKVFTDLEKLHPEASDNNG